MPLKLSFGVVGVGALGKHHARIFSELAAEGIIEFVGVFDLNTEAAKSVAKACGSEAFERIDDLIEKVDGLTVVTPTSTHFDLGMQLLNQGKHVLLEKPMTDDPGKADTLVRQAQAVNRVLQVGHVERFNPVFDYLNEAASEPRFIEAHRLSPYPGRSVDIGVVLDLMIHDLDVVLAFVRSEVTHVDAVGIPVLSQSEDIASARLRFANGCVANLTASRISPERMRKIRVFSGGKKPTYISLDYRAQEGFLYRLAKEHEPESSLLKKLLHAKDSAIVSAFGGKKIMREPVPIKKGEPLRAELESFVNCVANAVSPRVSGASAKLALEVAFEITRQIGQSHEGLTVEADS